MPLLFTQFVQNFSPSAGQLSIFRKSVITYGEEFLEPSPNASWRTIPCWLCPTLYSIYPQLPSIL